MKSYTRKGKVSKLATAALAMVFVLSSALTSFAASVEVSELNDSIYKATDPIVRVYDEDGNEVEVQYFTAEDWADMEVTYEDVTFDPRLRSKTTFSWEVKAYTRSCTPTVSIPANTRVSVTAAARPSDSTFWMGIMLDKDGTGWYLEAKEDASYTFVISTAGVYRVFVENRTDSKLSVIGGYNF